MSSSVLVTMPPEVPGPTPEGHLQLFANESADHSTDPPTTNGGNEPSIPDVSNQASSSSFTKANRSWKSTIEDYLSQYNMPCLMFTLIVLGSLAALGHHLYYQGLHDQRVQDPQWPIRFGTAVAFLVKASFVGSVDIAYRQQAWLMVKRRNYKISTLDSVFSACSSPWVFGNAQFLSEAYLAAATALFVWLLPLSAIASPSALSIRNATRVHSTTCDNISMLDFTRENGFNADSEDQERAGMSYWKLDRADQVLTYDQPSGELDRIFKLSVLSLTGPPKPPNPCPSVKSCTYLMDMAAPAYNCQKRSEFGGHNPMAYNRSQLLPTNILYVAYSSIDENPFGRPLGWDTMPDTTPELGVFTEVPSLWIGWLDNSSGHYSSIMECSLYNATTLFDVTFSGDNLSINQTAVNLISPLLPEGSSKAPGDSDYQQFSGYYAASYLFRQFMSGNLTWDSYYHYIDNTDAVQTDWFEPTTGFVLSNDFAATVENRFRDFVISMLSDTRLHSQINSSVPCLVTEDILVWNYAPFWLVLSYSVALGLNTIAIGIGVYCFRKNGCSMNTTFSTFIVTTRSTDLDELAKRQRLGRWPIDKEILDSRVRFGELIIPSDQGNTLPRRVAFAFPDDVRPAIDPKNYL
ncbi:hypothetical protein GGR51DRAFT_527249 [Nemania sp. FL0031]|nr:hypothetical protein GGR51DRAFT_527249 [Nemania sp. FL0031]